MTEFPVVGRRVDPPYRDGERAALEAWLDFHRETLAAKCAGLGAEQVGRRSVPPSSLSLRGLLRHMTEVERSWFARTLAGQDAPPLYCGDDDPDGDFDGVGRAEHLAAAEAVWAAEVDAWRAEVAASRRLAAGRSLDDVGAAQRRGEDVSLRWILLHMIEEYARHNGHADLLRERVDGATGD